MSIKKDFKNSIKKSYEKTKPTNDAEIDRNVMKQKSKDIEMVEDEENNKEETEEATTTASSGSYETPSFLAKNKKNWKPNSKPIYPGGKFVKVKDKCKTYPYCDQGDMNALTLTELKKIIKDIYKEELNDLKLEEYLFEMSKNKTKKILEEVKVDGSKLEDISEKHGMELKDVTKLYDKAVENTEDDSETILNNMTENPNHYTKEETEEATAMGGGGVGSFETKLGDSTVKRNIHTVKESDLVNIIEKVITEQDVSPKNQKDAMKGSKKDNEQYINDIVKKINDYLKSHTKAKFDAEPDGLPKGEGEIGEDDKVAFRTDDEMDEFIDHYSKSGGLENLEYDNIEPDKDRMDKYINGSTETGNSHEYGNAVKKSKGSEEVMDRKDKNVLNKLKSKSYNKDKQPVSDEDTKDSVSDALKEEINRIKKLLQ